MHAGAADVSNGVEAAAVGIGALGAVAGDIGVDKAGVIPVQGLPVEAEALHVGLAQMADENVRRLQQLPEYGQTLGPAGVERQLLLVAVDEVIQREVAVLDAHGVLAEVTGLVVADESLDADDIGAVLSQYLGAGGAGNEAGHVDNFHALEKFEFRHTHIAPFLSYHT